MAQNNGIKGYGDLKIGINQLFDLNITDIGDLQSYEDQISDNLEDLALTELALSVFNLTAGDSINLSNTRNTLLQNLVNISTQQDAKLLGITNARAGISLALATQNSSLNANSNYSQNEKMVNDIILQLISSGNTTFSASQVSNLQSIAEQCVLSGGDAVLIARDLLAVILAYPVYYDDDVYCYGMPRSTDSHVVRSFDGNELSIFPNPANDRATIKYSLKTDAPSRVAIFNLYGQAAKAIDLQGNQGSMEISISGLTPGIYFYSCNGITFGRLIIQ